MMVEVHVFKVQGVYFKVHAYLLPSQFGKVEVAFCEEGSLDMSQGDPGACPPRSLAIRSLFSCDFRHSTGLNVSSRSDIFCVFFFQANLVFLGGIDTCVGCTHGHTNSSSRKLASIVILLILF